MDQEGEEYVRCGNSLKLSKTNKSYCRVRCFICERKWESEMPCISHMKRMHSNLRFECKNCFNKFNSMGDLRSHLLKKFRKTKDNDAAPESPDTQLTVVLKVAMSGQGCVEAVKSLLDNMEGVEFYDVDLDEQKVTVRGAVTPEAVVQTVSKLGKKTEFWKKSEAKEEATPPAATSN